MNSPLSFLNSFKPLAGKGLEIALNRALALDAEAQERVKGWDGRKIAFKLANPPLALQVTVADGKLRVGKYDDTIEHDLAIDSNLTGLVSQSPLMRDASNKLNGRLRISGDAELAREVQSLMATFDPDMQLPFVKLFGDVLGVQVAQVAEGAVNHLKDAGKSFAETSALYFTEESKDIIPKVELSKFNDDVDILRDDVERIAYRIRKLSQ